MTRNRAQHSLGSPALHRSIPQACPPRNSRLDVAQPLLRLCPHAERQSEPVLGLSQRFPSEMDAAGCG
eukprot:12262199-Alexandrium_andersonii.AAC.1